MHLMPWLLYKRTTFAVHMELDVIEKLYRVLAKACAEFQ